MASPKTSSPRLVASLLVISKSASFQVKDLKAAPADIGRALGARYLLAGSIRRAENRVRVGIELTEAATGRVIWSGTYDAEVNDIFAVQANIARRVVGAAAVKFTRFEEERVLAKPTSKLAAYEFVLRGREVFSQKTRDDNDEAMELFSAPSISILIMPMPMQRWLSRITMP